MFIPVSDAGNLSKQNEWSGFLQMSTLMVLMFARYTFFDDKDGDLCHKNIGLTVR